MTNRHFYFLSSVVLAGVVAWTFRLLWLRSWPRGYEVAVVAWVGVQILIVAYPYKQYYAPCYLFAAIFLSYLEPGPWWPARIARAALFLVVCGWTVQVTLIGAQQLVKENHAPAQHKLIRWMNQITEPEDRVVGSLPVHPIARHDAFFLWFNTVDPNGFDGEKILERLPSYRDFVTDASFRAELAAHPPAFVVTAGGAVPVPYSQGQMKAINDLFARHGYRSIQVGPVTFAIRPDRFDLIRRVGFPD